MPDPHEPPALHTRVAIEPHVRRVWPETMIGWCRLLAGRLRDPLVGRDLLLGTLAGIVVSCTINLWLVMPLWLGFPPPVLPFVPDEAMSQLLLGGTDGLIEMASMTLPGFVFGLVPHILTSSHPHILTSSHPHVASVL